MDNRVVLYQDKDVFPHRLFDLTANRLPIIPRDVLFYDDIFSQMERQIARMHQDMRTAMSRLAPFPPMSGNSGEVQNRLQQLQNVYKAEEDGSRSLDVKLDMSSYKPEEIVVQVKDGVLAVTAQHDERSEGMILHNKFCRQFTLPPGTDLNKIESVLTKDGVLTIKGPVPAEGAKVIPIALTYQ